MDGVGRIEGGEAIGEIAPDNGRARQRDSLFLSAHMRIGTDPTRHEVRVRNLSEGGLMAELSRTPEPGTPVTLELRGLGELTGKIAWCTRGRVGVAFDCPIDPSRARKPVSSRKPGLSLVTPPVVPARPR